MGVLQGGTSSAGRCQNGHVTPAGAFFCPTCSLPLERSCCSRGHSVEGGQRFCAQCGEPVGAWRTGVLGGQQVRPYGDQIADWWAASGVGANRRLAGPDAAMLLSYPRTGTWRRVGAALIDYLLAILALALGPVALIVICVYGYFEGTTGQTLGKKALGIYTIKADTGEFIGGATGIGRKLLHLLDSFALFTGWIIGLLTGRTYADRIIGTVVVRRPPEPPARHRTVQHESRSHASTAMSAQWPTGVEAQRDVGRGSYF
jgi:uncharacterized RDD family membrane protein YckC